MTLDVEPADVSDRSPIVRPGPLAWLWYVIGGRLDARHRGWVLHDVTCRTWLLRHFVRLVLIIAPLVAIYLTLMPVSFDIRLLTGLTFGAGLFMFGLVNTLIDTDRRAVRAGYGMGLPAQLRSTNSVQRQRLASHQRRERIAERQARRVRG
jgi:hypothetical protein